FSKDHKTFTFTADSARWQWDVRAELLTRLGPAGGRGAAGARGGRGAGAGGAAAAPDTLNTCGGAPARGGAAAAAGGRGGRGGDFRNYSPDSSMFAFARAHNLYLVNVATKDTVQLTKDGIEDYSFGARDTLQERQQQELNEQQRQQGDSTAEPPINRDPRVRANVVWAPDSN